MRIRPAQENDLERWSTICVNAYPTVYSWNNYSENRKLAHEKNLVRLQNPKFHSVVAEKAQPGPSDTESNIVGVATIYPFEMNFHGEFVPMSGIGSIAVDLSAKKQGVAKELVKYFLEKAMAENISLAALYPFRPDFYHKMGFGLGISAVEMRLSPERFPKYSPMRLQLSLEPIPKIEKLTSFFNKVARERHGMCLREELEMKAMVEPESRQTLVVRLGEDIKGYCVFQIKKVEAGPMLMQDLEVMEMLWEDGETCRTLCTFFNSQADQVRYVDLPIYEEGFFWLFPNPTADLANPTRRLAFNVGKKTYSLLIRIVSFELLLSQLRGRAIFGKEDLSLNLIVTDTFMACNHRKFPLTFHKGIVAYEKEGDFSTSLEIDIQDLSSVFFGSVKISELISIGKSHFTGTKEELKLLSFVFGSLEKPFCLSRF